MGMGPPSARLPLHLLSEPGPFGWAAAVGNKSLSVVMNSTLLFQLLPMRNSPNPAAVGEAETKMET